MNNEMKTNRAKWFYGNKTVWLLWIIFGVSALSKIIVIPFLGAVSFPNSDEHIFIEMAKSLYYHKNLISTVLPRISQFDEALFPLIISPAYVFYSPENIVTVFRVFCSLLMSSAVFPAYQLGLAVLKDKKEAIFISIIAILIPEMTLSFSVVQEVIYYPLFLYALFLIYRKISENKGNTIYLGFVLFLLWICKAVGLTVFVGYIFYLLCQIIFINKFKNSKTNFVQIVLLGVIVIGLKELSTLVIRYLNSGSLTMVKSLYTSITVDAIYMIRFALVKFLSDFANGILYYFFFTAMAFMIFPVILVFDNQDNLGLSNKKFLLFLSICFITTVSTVVILIYMQEGGAARAIQRVHYRYLFPFIIPLITMLLKLDFSKIKLKIFGILYASFLLLYYLLFNPQFTVGSIIDAKSLLLAGYITNSIVNGSHILALLIVIFFIYLGYVLLMKPGRTNSRKIIIGSILVFLAINQAYATFKTYKYYTSETNGIERKTEYSILSNLVNSSPGTPILLSAGDPNWSEVLYSTQSNKEFSPLFLVNDVLEYVYGPGSIPNYIITPKGLPFALRNVNHISTGLKFFDVYQLKDISLGKIQLDFIISNIYSDLWLMDNARLIISGDQRGDQVIVTMNLETDPHAGVIFAKLEDSTGMKTSVQVEPNGTTVSLVVNKNPQEENFELKLESEGSFVPATMPDIFGSTDIRKLTYKITSVVIK
jgi:hypothetical protein